MILQEMFDRLNPIMRDRDVEAAHRMIADLRRECVSITSPAAFSEEMMDVFMDVTPDWSPSDFSSCAFRLGVLTGFLLKFQKDIQVT